MRNLLFAFSIILIMAACSDSGASNDNQYPVQVGSFTLRSDTEADWTGTMQTSKYKLAAISAAGDTTYLTAPDSLSMQIVAAAHVPNHFGVILADSSLSQQFFRDNDISSKAIELTGHDDNGITFLNGGVGGGFDLVTIQFASIFNCDSTYSADQTKLEYSLYFGDEQTPQTHYKTYILAIDGFRPTLERLVCDKPL